MVFQRDVRTDLEELPWRPAAGAIDTFEGVLYEGKVRTRGSKTTVPLPEDIRPVIEAWRNVCEDVSPNALMFPTFGRGKRAGTSVPFHSKNFLRCKIAPIAERLGIPKGLVTFQVMRRTLGTDMQGHGSLKDAQMILRHSSITTTGNVYVQEIAESTVKAINARTRAVLSARDALVLDIGKKGGEDTSDHLLTLSLKTQRAPTGSGLSIDPL